ncbi:MAG: phosphatidylserine decarboxylase [Candidatus Methylopumilus sp.]|nr:phosphatidylserine decarboxylase [Candidatus Methylopumilus sp.]
MVKNTYPIIAKEGWPFLAGSIAISALIFSICALWSIPLWAISLFILQFFRDPKRNTPSKKNMVISAADGKVIVIEKCKDEYLNRRAIKVSVFMNVFNVHSNKTPIKSTIMNKWYFPGKFLNATLSKASLENERCALHLKTKEGFDITCVQIAGLIARRILCYANKGDILKVGERYGFIRFGSRVDLYLPTDSKIKVTLGEKVFNGETIIAELKK